MNLEEKNYGVIDIIRIPFKCSPLYAVVIALQKILQGIIPTLEIIVTAKFLDAATMVIKENRDIKEIFTPLILVVLLIAYGWISEQCIKLIEKKLELKLSEIFRVRITEKRAKLKYKYIENQETWDLISRVAEKPEVQIGEAYSDFLSMISMFIIVLGLFFVLITNIWWSAFVILVFSIPLFYLSIKGGKSVYEAKREVEKYKRKVSYLSEVLLGREGVEERTLFSYTDEINKKWYKQYEIARKIEYKATLKTFLKMKGSSVVTAIISVLIVLVLIKPVQSGLVSVGMFISIVNGIFVIIHMMSWQITYYMQQLAKNREYLKDLSKFASLEEREGATDKPSKDILKLKNLEFINVSFKYPGTENYILKNISFTIEEGKHYSFVGVNGAGKTTITKLITGLYEEFEGEILINGVSIKEYSHSDLKALSSVVYQDFAKYFISLEGNVALGNILSMEEEKNEVVINKAINTIGLGDLVSELPQGVKTLLGKIKSGGLDISGGQWQRLAMARSIVSPAPLRILDEPTAALDPISESNLYEKFKEISKGGTTIFISHRLGSTKLADEIFVIGNGTIIENGSHEELMDMNGVYAKMYESQRSWYL